MNLTKAERNSVIRWIEGASLDPVDFDDPREDFDGSTRFAHLPSHSSITVGDPDPRYGTRVLRSKVSDGPMREVAARDWQHPVMAWLEDIRRDADTPDLWAERQSLGEIVSAEIVPEAENTSFTPDEQDEIKGLLQRAMAEANEQFGLSDEEQRHLAQRVAHFAEDTKSRKRIDWRNAIVSAMLGDALNEVLPLSVVKHVLEAVLTSALHLHGGAGPLGLGTG